MFKSIELLDKEAHRDLRLSTKVDYSYAAASLNSPIILREFFEASQYYPIIFTNDAAVTPVAIFGLTDRNLYLDERGNWTVPYIPAHIRRYPFILASSADPDNFSLAIDRAAPHFHSDGGEALFDDAGKPGALIESAGKMLQSFEQGQRDTQRALQPLEEKGVLVPRIIEINQGGTKRLVEGGRVVDETKLFALDDATLADWARTGLLQAIYAHWGSLRHFKGLIHGADRQEAVLQ
ncbi:MAG: SapC family protein [Elstera sp.]